MSLKSWLHLCLVQTARLVPGRVFRILADRRYFPYWEAKGVHLTEVEWGSAIPDTRALPERLWTEPSAMPGIELREDSQLALLDEFQSKFKAEYDALPRDPTPVAHEFYLRNRRFESVDAEMLWSMIRHFRPKRIIEIGSGFSTRVAAQALLRNAAEGFPGELTTIDPCPSPVIRAGFPGLTRQVTSKVEDLPLETFTALGANDILFVDSSHVLHVGSDVQHEYLELIPRVAPGVIVHCHDIHLPYNYPRFGIVDGRQFWNEQYLLQAFLACNREFEILMMGALLHRRHPDRVRAAIASYDPATVLPGSFWFRRRV